ncbi:integrase [Gossypium australe]|uniref:Integrase n=1 Tax=Gossypium australe TaxID=47621 RepID=A0A5B6VJN9_9ROSI|nr:integrase [Gossypium australe]
MGDSPIVKLIKSEPDVKNVDRSLGQWCVFLTKFRATRSPTRVDHTTPHMTMCLVNPRLIREPHGHEPAISLCLFCSISIMTSGSSTMWCKGRGVLGTPTVVTYQELQNDDSKLLAKQEQIQSDQSTDFKVDIDDILSEAHSSTYSIHSVSTKMSDDLKQIYWWSSMECKISKFVAKCLVCQQVKAGHQVLSGLLQPIMISKWKWERVTMDFVSGLPLTQRKKDSIGWIVRTGNTDSGGHVTVLHS